MPKNRKKVRKMPPDELDEEEEVLLPEDELIEDGAYKAEDSDDEDEDYEEKAYKARVSKLESLLEKAVGALEKQSKRTARLEKQIATLRKDDSAPDDVDEENVQLDPVDEEEDNEASEEAATKPAASTTDVGEAFTKADLVKLLSKQRADLKKEMEETIRASTPVAGGFAKGGGGDSVVDLIRKAITADRENSGGSFSTTEGRFGWRSGNGHDGARAETAKFVRKAFYGE